jgi:LacI family transcriptional regulator
MKDVAARAGVSLGTVSNALNKPEQVSGPTLERVQAAIEALGFVRNESARQLRSGRSRTLAYVVLDAGNPFFTDVARGVEEVADARGRAVFLCNSGENPAREDAYLDMLEQQRVEGVLITPVDRPDRRIAQLRRRGIPVVVVDRDAGPDHCSVTVDDIAGGELAATHLLESGHTRIAFVGGPTSIGQVADRLAGARKATAAAGAPDPVLLETTALNVAEGRRAGERLAGLPASRRPTAAFCANDLLALGLLQRMVRMGLDVPGDLAIVGYDDIEFAEAAAVPLTSVSQPRHLLGRTAAELLLAEARGEPGHKHRQLVFSPELMVRASSGVRRIDTHHTQPGIPRPGLARWSPVGRRPDQKADEPAATRARSFAIAAVLNRPWSVEAPREQRRPDTRRGSSRPRRSSSRVRRALSSSPTPTAARRVGHPRPRSPRRPAAAHNVSDIGPDPGETCVAGTTSSSSSPNSPRPVRRRTLSTGATRGDRLRAR